MLIIQGEYSAINGMLNADTILNADIIAIIYLMERRSFSDVTQRKMAFLP